MAPGRPQLGRKRQLSSRSEPCPRPPGSWTDSCDPTLHFRLERTPQTPPNLDAAGDGDRGAVRLREQADELGALLPRLHGQVVVRDGVNEGRGAAGADEGLQVLGAAMHEREEGAHSLGT